MNGFWLVTSDSSELSPRQAAITAGLGYLVVFFLTPYAWVDGLIVWRDAATTISNLLDSQLILRVSIACWLIVLIADTVVAWAVYFLLKPVNMPLSFLSTLFRVLFVAIFAVNILNWLNVLQLTVNSDSLGLSSDQIKTHTMIFLNAYEYGANIAFIFFGAHIGLLGLLLLNSKQAPRILSICLIVASAGYMVDSFGSFLSFNYASNQTAFWFVVAMPAIIAEFSLTLWLLFKGGKTKPRSVA